MNSNVVPLLTSAVAAIESLTAIVPAAATPNPTNVPAVLSANTAVYPEVPFPAGEVEGVIVTLPLVWLVLIAVVPIDTWGILVVPFGRVTSLYFKTCVSSGDASKIGIALIAAS